MNDSLPERLWRAFHTDCQATPAASCPRDLLQCCPAPVAASRAQERLGLLDCCGVTEIGRVRKSNEDQFLIADLSRSVGTCPVLSSLDGTSDADECSEADLLLVADGVGGVAGGELASQLAAEEVLDYLQWHRDQLARHAECEENEVCEDMKSALVWARQRLQQEAEASPQYARMGTTLTMAYLRWPRAYLAHVGDSRAYLYRSPNLIQLTHDQTMAQMLVDAGVISAELAELHPWRNALDSLLCRDMQRLTPLVYQQELTVGDQLLLCTDGLTKMVPAAKIAEILDSTPAAEDACRELVAAANLAGGLDNTTLVLARFGYRESGSTAPLELSADVPA